MIESGETRLLVDSGFSCKELVHRLSLRNISPSSITAVLVTHEHGDHFNGVPAFANKYKTPVWMSHGTSLTPKVSRLKNYNIFNGHESFFVEHIEVLPVPVPHDSREASQFVFKAENRKVGLLTDLGHISPFIKRQFAACNILLLEFNHDTHLLNTGRYPQSLKYRVGGNFGHLSNAQASNFLTQEVTSHLTHLIAMHVSEENNTMALVNEAVGNAFPDEVINFQIACQEKGFEWIEADLPSITS